MNFSMIFSSSFLSCIVLLLLLIIIIISIYFTHKINYQNIKISHMFDLISTLTEEMQRNNSNINQFLINSTNSGIIDMLSSSPSSETKKIKLEKTNEYGTNDDEIIEVSDDENSKNYIQIDSSESTDDSENSDYGSYTDDNEIIEIIKMNDDCSNCDSLEINNDTIDIENFMTFNNIVKEIFIENTKEDGDNVEKEECNDEVKEDEPKEDETKEKEIKEETIEEHHEEEIDHKKNDNYKKLPLYKLKEYAIKCGLINENSKLSKKEICKLLEEDKMN